VLSPPPLSPTPLTFLVLFMLAAAAMAATAVTGLTSTSSSPAGWSGPRASLRRTGSRVELLVDGVPSVPIWYKNHASSSGSSKFWATAQYELRLAAAAGVPVVSFVLACTETATCATAGKLDPSVAKMVAQIDQVWTAANGTKQALFWPTVYPHWPGAEPVLTVDSAGGGKKTSKECGNSPSAAWAKKTAAVVATASTRAACLGST
jgi:hypothetical protein